MAVYYIGQKVYLKEARAYSSCDASDRFGSVTGKYFVWSGAKKNNRIRICQNREDAGRFPEEKYVSFWVHDSDIETAYYVSSSKTSVSSSGDKSYASTASTAVISSAISSIKNSSSYYTVGSQGDVKSSSGTVGSIGDITFVVSSDKIMTFDGFSMSESVSIESHNRHLKKPVLEFTGLNSVAMNFDVMISSYLGVKNPMGQYKKLKKYMENGTKLPVRIGKRKYGTFLINSISMSGDLFHIDDWSAITVSLSLLGV